MKQLSICGAILIAGVWGYILGTLYQEAVPDLDANIVIVDNHWNTVVLEPNIAWKKTHQRPYQYLKDGTLGYMVRYEIWTKDGSPLADSEVVERDECHNVTSTRRHKGTSFKLKSNYRAWEIVRLDVVGQERQPSKEYSHRRIVAAKNLNARDDGVIMYSIIDDWPDGYDYVYERPKGGTPVHKITVEIYFHRKQDGQSSK